MINNKSKKPYFFRPSYFSERALVVLVIISFFIFIPVTIEMNPLLPYGNIIFICSVLALFFVSLFDGRRVILLNNSLINVLMLFYILFSYCLFSSLWSNMPLQVLWRSFIVFVPSVIIGMLFLKEQDLYKTMILFYKALMIFGLLLGSIGLFIYSFGDIIWQGDLVYNSLNIGLISLNQTLYYSSGVYRISSLTGNPNNLGFMLFFSISSAFGLYYMKKINIFLFITTVTILITSLIFTFSRNSWFATLISIFLINLFIHPRALSKRNKIIKLILFFFFFVLCSLGLLFLYWYLYNSFSSNTRLSLDLNGRIVAWDLLKKVINENPLFGTGFNTSAELLKKESGGLVNHSHSLYLAILSELGIFGCSIFVIIMLFVFIPIFSTLFNFRKRHYLKKEYIPFLVNSCILVVILIHQIVEISILRFNFFNVIWIFILFGTLQLRYKILHDERLEKSRQ
ncbi:O-antigen ligase family protein [Fictibacillus sp. FJAT-27399]|uniref:O-antigen ligase family protein n=1 Tax=Fictibacillus sp. FJAT-27399 TaxID=1729689 RepID=UPI0007831E4C|nr:O-antigen ligase family protein [Fictibacillus sp. FJAT-27399]